MGNSISKRWRLDKIYSFQSMPVDSSAIVFTVLNPASEAGTKRSRPSRFFAVVEDCNRLHLSLYPA
jgi:hypothetical protein